MSPVHVIVGEDERAEAMWAAAFTGAVDLYRFPRNVDAFERLTAAEAPIDLVVLTPAQRGPFNLTAEQFIARVLEGPLGAGRYLSNLHVIVVGQRLDRQHPRVMAVSTLDAAIRLVKFGEIERAPRPEAPQLPLACGASATPSRASARGLGFDHTDSIAGSGSLAGSIISRIWDAPDPKPAAPAAPVREPRIDEVVGGGAPVATTPAPVEQAGSQMANPQLFARSIAAGFVVAPAAAQPALASAPGIDQQQVLGGGADEPPMVGIPGEAIEVATGTLQPARAYQLPNGAGYRGPATKGGHPNPAHHATAAGGQPVPPALASQVQSMVYGGMVGNPADPLLTWSSTARSSATPVPAQPHAPAVQSSPVAAPAAPAVPQMMPGVPLEPPPGAYGAAAPVAAPTAPAPAADPFLRRAEQGGGQVAFG